jgi:uncharacterized protein (DUF427 family)
MRSYPTRTGTEAGFEPSPKWVRVRFGNQFIANSKRAHLLLPGGPPTYYFPKEDVRIDLLEPSKYTEDSENLGRASFWNIKAGSRRAENGAWTYPEPVSDSLDLSGFIAFDWNQMDGWYEEAEEVFVHPHDPYHRIDTLQSSRLVKVVILDEIVAESQNPVLLFETGLPVRFYLPKLDIRLDLLEPSNRITGCPYKGQAAYYSARIRTKVVRDICWYYRYPTHPMAKIAARIAFFNERADLYVDGVRQPRPVSMWSSWGDPEL